MPPRISRKVASIFDLKSRSLLASAGLSLSLFLPHASATDYVFTGMGDWYTAGTSPNWSPTVTNGLAHDTLNVAGNTATINGAVNYNSGPAGGDYLLGNGDTMSVDGSTASWTQALGTNNWVKVGGSGGVGTLVLQNGGTFSIADSGARLRLGQDGGTGIVTVGSTAGSGGLKIAGLTEISAASTINLQGGTNQFAQINIDGSLNVSGGTTTMSGGLTSSATTAINISGGTFTNSGNGTINLNPSATFTLSGNGQFVTTGTGEFQPGATKGVGVQSISGSAALDIAGLVAFQGGNTQKFDVNGGALTLRSGSYDGIYSNGGYFNFTTGSTGVITFTNTGTGQNNITEGQIEYNDMTYSAMTYQSVFDVEHPTATTTTISLLGGGTAVPEPATVFGGVLMIGALGWNQRRRLSTLIR